MAAEEKAVNVSSYSITPGVVVAFVALVLAVVFLAIGSDMTPLKVFGLIALVAAARLLP